ncbi:MAG TPA: hypothetical protein DCY20_00645 [Firmicutes bacterium]|nr:hypothetical protein [Bacillota bacterium]
MPKKRYYVIVPHCLLNPATRVHVLGHGFNLTQNLINYLLAKKIGIIQLPCPEFTAMGYWRNPQGRQQYDNIFFKKHCAKELENIIDMIIELNRNKHTLLCYFGIAGSPTCSIYWGKHKLNRYHTESIHAFDIPNEETESSDETKFGVMTEVLDTMLSNYQIKIPYLEVPIKENLNSEAVAHFFAQLDTLLNIPPEFRTDYTKLTIE